MKRKHQAEFEAIIDAMIRGAVVTDIVASVTPGGGKSSLPTVASRLIDAGLADKICVVVPRKSLETQGEAAFLNPFFRDLFGHRHTIRASTNEVDPCRGLSGFTTTYQAIGINPEMLEAEFRRHRYILILDESHHVQEGGLWHDALSRLYEAAVLTVHMTGTIHRGDDERIAFIPYDESGYPVTANTGAYRFIRYSRTDAIAEKAILPIEFHFLDGALAWVDKKEKTRRVDSFRQASLKENSDALFTALNTDYAVDLLRTAVRHWQRWRKEMNPSAQLLVVTDGIENARRMAKKLTLMGLPEAIATSHESAEAARAIKAFRAGELPCLTTIAMAYEGMDAPRVTHTACLTHIRSTPWIEQMVARGVRIDPDAGPYESQRAFCFAPKDKKMQRVVARIEEEQGAAANPQKVGEEGPHILYEEPPAVFNPFASGGGGARSDVTPLAGSAGATQVKHLGGGGPVVPRAHVPVETPKEEELRLRREIQRHVNRYAAETGAKEEEINSTLKVLAGGKPRREMTLTELREMKESLPGLFPLDTWAPCGEQVKMNHRQKKLNEGESGVTIVKNPIGFCDPFNPSPYFGGF